MQPTRDHTLTTARNACRQQQVRWIISGGKAMYLLLCTLEVLCAVCCVLLLLLLRPHLYIGLEVHIHLGLQQAREGLQELLVSIRKRVQHLMIKQQHHVST
jgi:hypothetical protein